MCLTGLTGPLCEFDKDECESSGGVSGNVRECNSHGECVNTPGSYFCDCYTGYEGGACENVSMVDIEHGAMFVTM